jgi:putative flavoprotein involved in K+ transport
VTVRDVVIVGAGAAGLGAAARLRAAGLEPLVIDRADAVGSAWRTRYDSFRLHTPRLLSGLPGWSIPRSLGPWVARDDFLGYLADYARRFALAPQLGVELQALERAGDGWHLATSDGPVSARQVVLATGACTEPRVPDWPGRATFTAPLIHSWAYRAPAPYAGQRVLVVGSGNSAAEVAVDLASRGDVRVDLAVRTPPSVLRRDLHGIPTQPIGIALRHVPPVVVNPLAAGLRRLSVPDLAAYGLPRPKAPLSQFLRTGTVPVLDHGFVAAVRSGAITVRPAVGALDEDGVVHSDGSRSRPDAVIAATGYTPGLQSILGPLGLLDDRGLPRIASNGARGLYTVGITVVLSGVLREIRRDADRLGRILPRG